MASIAITGAGLVGRFLALSLGKKHQVTLFEQNTLANKTTTGRIAAAMVAPTAESIVTSNALFEMGYQGLALWPKLLDSLNISTPFQQSGSIILAHRQDFNDLRHFQQRINTKSSSDMQVLSQQQLAQLEPELPTHFNHSLWLPNEGHIDNEQLYQETEQQILSSGINLIEHCQVTVNDQTITLPNQSQKQFDWVIDCRGLGAKQQLKQSNGLLRGVRGEVARVRAPEVNLTRPIRLMHPRYPIYIVPKSNHQYVIGATEIESQDNKGPSVRSVLELLSAAYSVHKSFAEAEVLNIQAGLRPTLIDNEPKIILQNHRLEINGLYRHGYLLTPYILNQALILLNQQGLDTACLETSQLDFNLIQHHRITH